MFCFEHRRLLPGLFEGASLALWLIVRLFCCIPDTPPGAFGARRRCSKQAPLDIFHFGVLFSFVIVYRHIHSFKFSGRTDFTGRRCGGHPSGCSHPAGSVIPKKRIFNPSVPKERGGFSEWRSYRRRRRIFVEYIVD